MENYAKVPTADPPQDVTHMITQNLTRSIELDPSVIHMNVKTGSKVTNLLNFANTKFKNPEVKQVTWNGSGEALNKVVACAEIMKKAHPNLFQINKIGFIENEEIWNSKLEDLRDIKVTKQIPSMCILLSKTPLDQTELGYQTKSSIEDFFSAPTAKPSKNKQTKGNPQSEEIYVKRKKSNKNQ